MHVNGTAKQADDRISIPGTSQAVRGNSDLPAPAWGAASTHLLRALSLGGRRDQRPRRRLRPRYHREVDEDAQQKHNHGFGTLRRCPGGPGRRLPGTIRPLRRCPTLSGAISIDDYLRMPAREGMAELS